MPQQTETTPEQYAAMEPDKVLFTMRIIAGVLIAGVVFFGAIASFLVFGKPPEVPPGGQPPAVQANGPNVLLFFAAGLAVLNAVLSFVVPSAIAKSGVKGVAKMAQEGTSTGPKELFGRLLGIAQTNMIIALALVEGAAFFNLIMFITTKLPILLAVTGALLLVMAIHFPTKFKLARWLEDQQRMLS